MRKYVSLIAGFLVLVSIGFGAYYLSQAKKSQLTFSNTMKWDESLLAKASKTPRFIPDFKQKINLLPFPGNNSDETKHEIETLLAYQKNRTESQISLIKDEALPQTTVFGGQIMDSYFDTQPRPKTALLLSDAFTDLSIIMFYEKLHFDRVRPSKLDPRVMPILDVPGHPAYPSAHSTQLHFLALFLGELRPSEKTTLWSQADAIAKNREVAGLHYPSDSAAGVSLAKQAFALMMADPEFKKRFDDVRSEWQ